MRHPLRLVSTESWRPSSMGRAGMLETRIGEHRCTLHPEVEI